MKSTILVNGIRLFAYHGCLDEESRVGRMFQVDVSLEADLCVPAQSDRINDTINYVTVFEIVKREMEIRSHLIEHVAQRICNSIRKTFPQISHLKIRVTKLHPPIAGNVESTAVEIEG